MKRTISSNAAKFLSKAALSVAKSNANQVCRFIIHQPKLPDKVKKLRKF